MISTHGLVSTGCPLPTTCNSISTLNNFVMKVLINTLMWFDCMKKMITSMNEDKWKDKAQRYILDGTPMVHSTSEIILV